MTTSGEYSIEYTNLDIITEAYEILQATGAGEPLSGQLYAQGLRSLNQMIKLWEAQGIHLWANQEYTLFLAVGQERYDLTDPSTRVVNGFDWSSTTLAADAVATNTDITLESVEGLALGYPIGILNDDNDLQWSVVEAIADPVVSLRDALTVDASSGRRVRFYAPADRVASTAAVAGAVTDQTLELASVEGFEPDFTVQISQDDGTVLHTTINSVDFDANTITFDDALTAIVTIGNDVVAYSSEQNFTPFSRIPDTDSVRRHSGESSDYEIPIVMASREDYFMLPNKNQEGTPIQAYYDRQEPIGQFFFWNSPNTALEYINFTGERNLQVMVDPDDTFDFPEEWYLAITYNLAKLLIPKVGCSAQRRAEVRGDAQSYLDQVLAFDSDIYPVRMQMEEHG